MNESNQLTEEEDFGKSPPFGPEPEIGGEEQEARRPNILSALDLDQDPEAMLDGLMQIVPEAQQEGVRAAFAAEMKRRVAESRATHIAFVTKHMHNVPLWGGVKFADALEGKTYFVSFLLTNHKKQRNITIPPIMMGGKVETVKPGALYACSGKEARMLERVLASKGLEVLNITPAPTETQMASNWMCENYERLYPSPNKKPPRNAFAGYRETEPGPGDTVAVVTDMEGSEDAMTQQFINAVTGPQPQGE